MVKNLMPRDVMEICGPITLQYEHSTLFPFSASEDVSETTECQTTRRVRSSHQSDIHRRAGTVLQGVPGLSEHALLREHRNCRVTVEAAVTKLF